MIDTLVMPTLDLKSAAHFLGLHPNTLQARAKSGAIPGAKIGKAWRFIEADLEGFIRSQYPSNKPQTPAPVVRAGGRKTHATMQLEKAFEAALNLPPRRR